MTVGLKRTPLYEVHRKLGATIVEFGGWEMPVYYTSVIDEHLAVRNKVGLFDTCHLGEIEVAGSKTFDFLQWLLTNDLSPISSGRAVYSPMCYEDGTTIDDLYVYKLGEDRYWLVVNAANILKDYEWIQRWRWEGLEVRDLSQQTGKLDLQGPLAETVLQKLTPISLKEIERFYWFHGTVGGMRGLISRTGYTGEDGFELYFDARDAVALWETILDTGMGTGIKPVGLGARDTLRLEACYSLYGQEMNETVTPVEAGLRWAVKEDKGDFIGKEILAQQKLGGTERTLIAFEMLDRSVPRHGYDIMQGTEKIGFVTSGSYSPTLKKGIGLGLVKREHSQIGRVVGITIRDSLHGAQIVKKPFYRYKGGT